ncbi:hypothetical protein Ait01nite_025590 [Actinoplanes italicus]|uniref:Cellulose binding domain-containing protein n=1 Tax=Actinoplanes italicus TaxID=113567 RepID=A0A2T0KFE4_9ACTN|nr:cellulose binding domain-containing protein [Actinoplanes italicus]PRX22069.1 cellulose binding domain-containing protein [Actinoplanes italicus]GIE29514.1 hypothetical protein Ait01nite_025590 [Actinoplanes italicus]
MSERRTPADVVRDAAWRVATAMLAGPSPEPRVRRAGGGRRPLAARLLLVTGALAAVAITAVLVVLLVTRPYQQSVKPEEAAGLPEGQPAPVTVSPSVSPSAAVTSPAAVVSRSPARAAGIAGSRSPVASASVAPVALAAGYTTTPYVVGLLGYRTEVTVANPGAASRTGWTVTVTLPRSTLWINEVKGATATQQDAVWTFVPDGTTAAVAPGEQVTFSFEVHGATLIDAAPEDCRIDGTPCTS